MSEEPKEINDIADMKIGMGATYHVGSDSYAATVTKIVDGKVVQTRDDIAKRTDSNGLSGPQVYEYTANPKGDMKHWRVNRSGRWVEVSFNARTKRWQSPDSVYRIVFGEREHHVDPDF
jgi:predicted transcriptional regulator